jgi:polygalacturonase
MIISSYYSAAKYGAAGDGKTNDAPAIQHAMRPAAEPFFWKEVILITPLP